MVSCESRYTGFAVSIRILVTKYRCIAMHRWIVTPLLVAWTAPSHYLNQCWNIVNWALGNKLQWNFNRNSNIFIEENTFENVVCKMLLISSRPQCVNNMDGIVLNFTVQYSCDIPLERLFNTEAETKWTPFTRRHFQMHFLEWKYVNFNWDFTEVYC